MKIEDRLSDALHGYADGIEPEPGSWARIEARFDDSPSPGRPSRRPLILAGVALALIVVLITVLAVRDDRDGSRVATDGGPAATATTPVVGVRPPGVLGVTTSGAVQSMDASTGQVHEKVASIPEATAIDPIGPDGLTAVYGSGGATGTCGSDRPPTVGRVVLASGKQTLIVNGSVSPSVSPDGRFVAYGIQCDGVVLGYSDLRNGRNYRIGLVPSTEVLPVDSIEPLAWAADSVRLLYRTVRAGETPRYYVGRLWPLAETTRPEWTSAGLPITAAAFIDNETLAIAEDTNGGSEVKPLDLHELPDRAPLFSLPKRITSLVADASGHHFLAVTSDHELYRWSTGDAAPTKLADDTVSAGWIPWS